MRTAWLEEHGIGVCSGREFLLARKRRPTENIPPCPTGTHTATSMLIFTPVLFVSISHPFTPTCPILTVSHSVLVSDTPNPPLSSYAYLAMPCPCTIPNPPTYPFPNPPNSVRTACTVPLIDSIHGQSYSIEPQGGGDEDGFARGAWDWSMLWKRVPLGDREKKRRKTHTEPYRYRKQVD